MKVFLTSSPFLPDTEGPRFNPANGLVEGLKEALPPFPRVLCVASSPDRHDLTCRYGNDIPRALAFEGIDVGGFQVLTNRTREDAKWMIDHSDFLVLHGGHVPTQNAFFREIGLRDLLADYDGVVMGISAGTMNAADRVYMQPEEEGESSPEFVRWADGLGLSQINVLPHYQNVKDDIVDGLRLFEDITYPDSFGHTFFALPDGSFVYVEDGKETIFGESYRIRDGILEQMTVNGQCRLLSEPE
ncbi:MAG: Type 1 glutamine amidotransferase-like domain-containing protein [Eubacteriales bacterium]|nr:Type 1 glutamine amidotransferase-like domain-containing protein [Eubacteriales bacterium]